MPLEVYLAYISTVLLLMSTPGPSHLLMLSNSMGNGFRRSLATAAGDLSANICQIFVASLGLVGLVYASEEFFSIIKWGGVVYLISMGLKQWFSKDDSGITKGASRSASSLYWQGFTTSAANPKAIIFFAALLPQFVNPAEPTAVQFLILGATYIFIDGIFLMCYGGFAEWFMRRLKDRIAKQLNRIAGGLLIVAAILLGLKSIEK